MLDNLNRGTTFGQNGTARLGNDMFHGRRNLDGWPKINSFEDNPMIGRCGTEFDSNIQTAKESETGHGDSTFQRALLT